MKWKITLADNWRTLHRRGTVIVSGALAVVTAAGPAIVDAWNSMPADLKALLPQGVQRYAALVAFALILVVRYTAVRRVAPPAPDAAQGNGDAAQ
jgi:hypothetical protein